MKTGNKSLLLILLLLLAASVIYNLKQGFRAIENAKKLSRLSNSSYPESAQIVTRYIKDNVEHAVIEENDTRANGSKPYLFIDSLKNLLSVKEKQLLQATKVNGMLQAENLVLKQYSDSIYGYQDKWLKLSYNAESNQLDLNYELTLSTAKYWKRKWFLAPKQYYIDVFSDDQRVKIKNVKRFTIETPKPKKFGIGLSMGYSYSLADSKWQPYIGLGLNYNLIRF